jgi:hypothetical protein
MLENASLPVKAAGGGHCGEVEMVRLGVKRIGTSGARKLPMGKARNQNINHQIKMTKGFRFSFIFFFFSHTLKGKY